MTYITTQTASKTLKTDFISIVDDWKVEFTNRIKYEVASKKQNFTYTDALSKSNTNFRTSFDGIMISYDDFIDSNPLASNDYYKYVNLQMYE